MLDGSPKRRADKEHRSPGATVRLDGCERGDGKRPAVRVDEEWKCHRIERAPGADRFEVEEFRPHAGRDERVPKRRGIELRRDAFERKRRFRKDRDGRRLRAEPGALEDARAGSLAERHREDLHPRFVRQRDRNDAFSSRDGRPLQPESDLAVEGRRRSRRSELERGLFGERRLPVPVREADRTVALAPIVELELDPAAVVAVVRHADDEERVEYALRADRDLLAARRDHVLLGVDIRREEDDVAVASRRHREAAPLREFFAAVGLPGAAQVLRAPTSLGLESVVVELLVKVDVLVAREGVRNPRAG